MGIPGLSTKLATFKRFRRPPYFEGGDFYIDGLNLIHHITSRVDKEMALHPAKNSDKIFRKALADQLEFYFKLKPRKMYMFIDAMSPLEKLPLTLKRQEAKLAQVSLERMHLSSVLLVDIVKMQYPSIVVVYSGGEAEDAIMQYIYGQRHQLYKTRQFIFSGDSDLFTFALPDRIARMVEIVPITRSFSLRNLTTINVMYALSSIHVKPEYLQHFPVDIPGVTVVSPRDSCRGMLALINKAKIYGVFQTILTSVDSPSYLPDPNEIGLDFRRANYAVIMDNYFAGQRQDVTEYRQQGLILASQEVPPLSSEDLRLFLKIWTTVPLDVIIRHQYESLGYDWLKPYLIDAVVNFVRDVCSGKPPRPSKTLAPRTHGVFCLLVTLLYAIYNFNAALGNPRDLHYLIWRITPHQLSPYVVESWQRCQVQKCAVHGP